MNNLSICNKALRKITKNPLGILEYFVLASAVLVTLVTLVWMLAHGRYGMDLTDESYYLIWMSNPWFYPVSLTQFGFIYHPLYLLLQGDIALLRQANILTVFVSSWMLCVVFFRATLGSQEYGLSWQSMPMLALAAVTATCSLIYFTSYGWLATPSYNSLVFQALILASIGLLLAEKTASTISVIGWLLIGIGGWLSFMGKPTSTVALGFIIAVCLPLTGKFNLRLLGISLLTTIILLVVSAWVIDGSLIAFVNRLRNGLETARMLDTERLNMFRVDDTLMGHQEQWFLASASVTSFLVICLTASKKKFLTLLGFNFTLLFALISLAIVSGYFLLQINDVPEFPMLLILAVPISAGFFVLTRIFSPLSKVSQIRWGIAFYFAVLPYVSALGTTNNYWMQCSLCSLFWVLAGLVILMPAISQCEIQRVLLPAVMSGQLISVFLLQLAMDQPYLKQPRPLYQEPFRQYKDVVTVGINESEVVVPKYLADFYRNVKKMAIQAGFQSDVPVIDMTGSSPGVLYAIGAKSIGQPWMIGNFRGSNNVAVFMLNRVSCSEIIESWLLVDPDSKVKLSPTILNNFGISFEQDFKMVAELNIPPSTTSYNGMPTHRLQLWKPLHATQDDIAVCEQKRTPH